MVVIAAVILMLLLPYEVKTKINCTRKKLLSKIHTNAYSYRGYGNSFGHISDCVIF